METIGVCFSIFGFIAFCSIFTLSSRVSKLEKQLSKVEGTSFYEDRKAILEAVNTYIGKSVIIGMREDETDFDIINYGNSKHGKNVIIDADEDWMLVEITSIKGTKEKLLRISSVISIKEVDNK